MEQQERHRYTRRDPQTQLEERAPRPSAEPGWASRQVLTRWGLWSLGAAAWRRRSCWARTGCTPGTGAAAAGCHCGGGRTNTQTSKGKGRLKRWCVGNTRENIRHHSVNLGEVGNVMGCLLLPSPLFHIWGPNPWYLKHGLIWRWGLYRQ